MQAASVGAVGAGVGPRAIAIIIDAVLVGIVGGIVAAAIGTDAFYWSFGLLTFVYFVVMEKTQGATVGKMALGLKVVMEDGSALSWGASLIRNLLRIIDGLFVYLIGAIFVWTSPRKQRIGDRVGKTLVVKKGQIVSAPTGGQF